MHWSHCGNPVHHLQSWSCIDKSIQQPLATRHNCSLHITWISFWPCNPGNGCPNLFVCFGKNFFYLYYNELAGVHWCTTMACHDPHHDTSFWLVYFSSRIFSLAQPILLNRTHINETQYLQKYIALYYGDSFFECDLKTKWLCITCKQNTILDAYHI